MKKTYCIDKYYKVEGEERRKMYILKKKNKQNFTSSFLRSAYIFTVGT